MSPLKTPPTGLTPAQLKQQLGLPKSSIHSLLAALERRGYGG
jgi:DNA-binding IclR family transcriptional regulator